jgi:hypothetical protein
MNYLFELVGWLGTALTVVAYFLNLKDYFSSSDKIYILLNLAGGILLVIHTVFHAAFPAALENMIWASMAFWALVKKKPATKPPKAD